jgi:hypothetical protein
MTRMGRARRRIRRKLVIVNSTRMRTAESGRVNDGRPSRSLRLTTGGAKGGERTRKDPHNDSGVAEHRRDAGH